MNKPSRRRFLANSSRLAVSALGFGFSRSVFSSQPNLKFPTEPHERLAVASWPFRTFIDSPTNSGRDRKQPGMDLKDFPAMVVSRFGLHNIEPLSEHFRSTEAAYLHEMREACEKAAVHVVDIASSPRASFYSPDPAKRRAALEYGKKWIDIAIALGSPSVRTHIEGVHKVKPDVDRTADSLTELASYGAERNIIVALENDDLVSEDAFFLVKVIEKVNSPYLDALPDFCNSMLSGNEQFCYDAVTAMFKHAYNIAHMKDSEVDNGKIYTVDPGKCFAIAKAAGYRGYFSMEWEGAGEPYAGTQKLIDESLRYLT